jgi:hypothetical protein
MITSKTLNQLKKYLPYADSTRSNNYRLINLKLLLKMLILNKLKRIWSNYKYERNARKRWAIMLKQL